LLTLAGADHPGFLLFKQVAVEPLVTDTARRWGPAVAREWVTMVDAPGSLTADRERVEAALDALIENAVNATEVGDRISLGATAEGSTLVLEVADDGCGIAAEDLPYVFEPFSRREPDRGRRSGGTGLGLAIVRAVVEAHGGTVEVRSRAGRGTSFRMRLPRYTNTDHDVEQAVAPTPIRSAT
jgi:signal transduction histidine kinase